MITDARQYGWVKVAQLSGFDTTDFPLEIGNQWFYKYQSISPFGTPPPYVIVKEIVDTTQSGSWVVKVYRPHQDSVTLWTEDWTYSNGKFYLNSTKLYDTSITQDTSWSYFYYGSYSFSYTVHGGLFSGETHKAQAYSESYAGFFSSRDFESDVYLGLGIYYTHLHTFGGESFSDQTTTLVGFMNNGILIGDTILTSVNESVVPLHFGLSQNYPNPSNPLTTIEYKIIHREYISLKVYNISGKEVRTLVDQVEEPGLYRVHFNGSSFSSGVYYYTLRTSTFRETKRMILVK